MQKIFWIALEICLGRRLLGIKKKKRKQGIGEKISLEVYADEEILKDEKISRSKLRRDIPISFSQKGRQFAFRQEACISIEVLSGIEKGLRAEDIEHDVFSTLEGV